MNLNLTGISSSSKILGLEDIIPHWEWELREIWTLRGIGVECLFPSKCAQFGYVSDLSKWTCVFMCHVSEPRLHLLALWPVYGCPALGGNKGVWGRTSLAGIPTRQTSQLEAFPGSLRWNGTNNEAHYQSQAGGSWFSVYVLHTHTHIFLSLMYTHIHRACGKESGAERKRTVASEQGPEIITRAALLFSLWPPWQIGVLQPYRVQSEEIKAGKGQCINTGVPLSQLRNKVRSVYNMVNPVWENHIISRGGRFNPISYCVFINFMLHVWT